MIASTSRAYLTEKILPAATEKLKILLVGDYPNDARLGSSKVLHKLRDEFHVLGHACDILFEDEIGPRPQGPRMRHALRPLFAARAIASAFNRRGPYDVLDVASGEGFIFGLQRRLGKYRGTVFISRSNGLEHLNYQRMLDDHRAGFLKKPWTKRIWYPAVRLSQVAGAARLADRLILLNESDRDFAIRRGWQPAERIHLIPHGISGQFLDYQSSSNGQRGAGILFCGTWDNAKGIKYLTEAYSLLVGRGLKLNLTVLGGGVSEENIIASFPEHARPFVKVLGRAPEAEVMSHYRKHDLLVFCSTYEGYGMVLAEAMSQGLPVVSTPVGCATSLIKDRETGLLVPPRNSEALADSIQALLDNQELRSHLSQRGRERISGMTWRRTAVETLSVYAESIRDKNSVGQLRKSVVSQCD